MNYDLEERTLKYSEEVIELCRVLKHDVINSPLINQLIRSATSIGANYCEANAASSQKDFRNKIYICKKEAQETIYWLRLIGKYNRDRSELIRKLENETSQFVLIFGKIISTINHKSALKL